MMGKGLFLLLLPVVVLLSGCGCRQDTETGSLPDRDSARDYCRDYCYDDSKCTDWDYDYNDVTRVYWCYCYD